MPIEFPCTACNKLLRVPDGSVGKKAKCPSCQTVLEIPISSSSPPADPFAAPAGTTGPSAPAQSDQVPSNQGSSPFSGPGSFAHPGQTPPPTPPPMSDNPFASPSAASEYLPGVTSAKGPIVPTRIHFDLLGKIWNVFTKDFGAFLLMGLVLVGVLVACYAMFFVIMIISMSGFQNRNPDPVPMVIGMVSGYVIFLLAMSWVGLGTIKFCLRIVRGETPHFGDIFSAGRYLLRGIGIGFLLLIATYGIMLLCMAPGMVLGDDVLLVIGQVLAMLLSLPISILFLPSYCILVDHDLGVFRSMRMSCNIMSGNLLISFLLWLIIYILGVLFAVCTCGLGYIAVFPFFALALVMVYLGASGQLVDQYPTS